MQRIEALYRAREGGQRWENFARLWQGISPQGERKDSRTYWDWMSAPLS